MNDFTLRRAHNDGWVLSIGANDGSLHPFHAFSSTQDLLKALPEMLGGKKLAVSGGVEFDLDQVVSSYKASRTT
ncbi:hypothetical protein [Rhizobium leguminosarum]